MAHAVGTFKYILNSGGPEGIPAQPTGADDT